MTMSNRFSRRRFLLAGSALAGGVIVTSASCGGGGTSAPSPEQAINLVRLFSPDRVLAAGIPQRIPFAVVAGSAVDIADDAELPVRVFQEGKVIEELTVRGHIVDHDHVGDGGDPEHQHADLLRYFPLRATLPTPGVYDLEADFGVGRRVLLPVQAFPLDEIVVPLTGDQIPPLVTPTVTDPAGVDTLCTRAPEACSFHGPTVAEVLAEGRPMALLIATPAFCQTAFCGPVLETLLEHAPTVPDVVPIHLEVYANPAALGGNFDRTLLEMAPQVAQLGLTFEPSLFLVNSNGVIADRIDNIYDASELVASLESLV